LQKGGSQRNFDFNQNNSAENTGGFLAVAADFACKLMQMTAYIENGVYKSAESGHK